MGNEAAFGGSSDSSDPGQKPAQIASTQARDFLFVSYAYEDEPFVRWLVLKLARCGYRVWWDQQQLHGGGAFPTRIDEAIKERSFRLLAVLSHHSSHKPNPERERTLALALGKERGEDFLIPINLELKASELPWMMSNLGFVPFMDNWATGLEQLLVDLRAAGAPCYPEEAAALVRANLAQPTFVVKAEESVWLNLFPIGELPGGISRYEWVQDIADSELTGWVYHRENARTVWAFESPPAVASQRKPERDQFALSLDTPWVNNVNLSHIASSLIRQYVEHRCRARGLIELREERLFYFPETLEVASHLPFTLPNGRSSWTKLVGTRRVWQQGKPEQIRYHLAFAPKVELRRYGQPVLLIRPTAHFMTMTGGSVDRGRNVRRARALRRAWFNDKWLARVAAIGSYLAETTASWTLSESLRTTIAGVPLSFRSSPSLDEQARAEWLKHDDSEDSDDSDDADLPDDDYDSEDTNE